VIPAQNLWHYVASFQWVSHTWTEDKQDFLINAVVQGRPSMRKLDSTLPSVITPAKKMYSGQAFIT